MSVYPQATTDDPRFALAAILSDALIGLRHEITVDSVSGTGGADVSALIVTEDGRAFTLTVRREYERDR